MVVVKAHKEASEPGPDSAPTPPVTELDRMVLSGITGLKERIALVRAAYSMAVEGVTRAQVKDVVARTLLDHDIDVLPSVAGQAFSVMGIQMKTSHGRNRLVLEMGPLSEVLATLEQHLEDTAKMVARAEAKFAEVMDRAGEWEARLRDSFLLAERQQEIRAYLDSKAGFREEVARLEAQHSQMAEKVTAADALKQRVTALKAEVDDLDTGSLLDTEAKLQNDLDDHQNRVALVHTQQQALSARRQELHGRINRMVPDQRMVNLAELGRSIEQATEQLKQLGRQVKEREKELRKVDRQLGRNKALLAKVLEAGG